MNSITAQNILKLQECFNVEVAQRVPIISHYPIGIEIEVKWRDYYPDLWEKYLSKNKYANLSELEKESLTEECTKRELILYEKLNKIAQCGISKGGDKYWEFVFEPVTNLELLDRQIRILQEIGALPDGRHSLHITIGGLKACKDVYYMLLVMEILMCSQERILSAFNKDQPKCSATWARKGMGGIFEKCAKELKHGYENAVELRTLELSADMDLYSDMKWLVSMLNTIQEKKQGLSTIKVEQWNKTVEKISQKLSDCYCEDKNWQKPNLDPASWQNYAHNFFIK